MSRLFKDVRSGYSTNQNISSWDTSNVTDMSEMFDNSTIFTNASDRLLKQLGYIQCNYMRSMFGEHIILIKILVHGILLVLLIWLICLEMWINSIKILVAGILLVLLI